MRMTRRYIRLVSAVVALAAGAAVPASWALTDGPTISCDRRAYVAFREGLTAGRESRWGGAAAALNRAHELAPKWPAPIRLLAYLWEAQGHSAQAIEAYRQVLSLQPDDVFASGALAGLGEPVRPLGDEGAAKAYRLYRAALERLLSRERRPPTATAEQALGALPDWADASLLVGLCCDLDGERGAAIHHYRQALAREPDDLFAGQALVDLGYFPAADTDVAELEQLLVDLINDERLRAGARALRENAGLAACARRHSAEMRDLEYFGHESPTPELRGMRDRYRLVSAEEPRVLGENIARRYRVAGPDPVLSREAIARSHEALMSSSGHRRNILNPAFEFVGIGIAINDCGDYWVTEMFMAR